jgi:non-homologous end joining protein Ku
MSYRDFVVNVAKADPGVPLFQARTHLKAKQAGMPPQPKQSWAVPRRAINLMEALRRSIAEDKKAEARRPAAARKRA